MISWRIRSSCFFAVAQLLEVGPSGPGGGDLGGTRADDQGGHLGAGLRGGLLESLLADEVLGRGPVVVRRPRLAPSRRFASSSTICARAVLSSSSNVDWRDINAVTVFICVVTSAGSCEFSITESPIRAGSPLA